MSKHKHLEYSERCEIEKGLANRFSFKKIAKILDKDCTTISGEVKLHAKVATKTYYGRSFNNCVHRYTCELINICNVCNNPKTLACKFCGICNHYCKQYKAEVCPKLSKPPYVCNGCETRRKCTLMKKFYIAEKAHSEYKEDLSESRSGIYLCDKEIEQLNNLLTPLIKEKGQSIHHVMINHKDEIMMSETKLYRIIDMGLLEVRNIDLPKKSTHCVQEERNHKAHTKSINNVSKEEDMKII